MLSLDSLNNNNEKKINHLKPETKMLVTTWILTKVTCYNQGKTALCQRQNYSMAETRTCTHTRIYLLYLPKPELHCTSLSTEEEDM